ncbi:MAG: helix-turn-helix domain-containing protein [Pyrinomonadaceae bacterium]
MKTINIQQITADDVENAVRNQLERFFAERDAPEQPDELGGMKLAMEITGLSKPSIYRLVSNRSIPHSKRGKKLYFKRSELMQWIDDGRRKTRCEIGREARERINGGHNGQK